MRTPVALTGWEVIREGKWGLPDGSTITKVSPPGRMTLYAVRIVGSRRPLWFATLAEAKRYQG
jgi:hypothetical protein